MAAKSGSKKKSGSTRRIVDAGEKDRRIAELNSKIQLLEKELRLKQEGSTSPDIPERKRAEEALRESEERFQAFMNNSPTIGWMKDEQGRHVYLSKTYEDRFGVKLEDWRGKTDFDLWPQEIAEQFWKNDRKAMTTGKTIEVVEKTQNPAGSLTYWLSYKFPFRDASGNRYIGGIGVDITERKLAEEALRESEAGLAKAQEIAHLANWELDVRTNRVCGSDELYRMFNLKPDVTLDAYVEKMHSYDQAMVVKSINAAIYDGAPYNIDYRIVPRPGEIHYVHAEGEVTLDENGYPSKFFGTLQDITERKRAEEALQESEERFRALADNIPNLAWMANPDGWIFWYNKQWYDYTGTTLEEMQGWGWQKVHHPDYVKAVTEEWSSRIKAGQPYDNVFPLRGKDGNCRWFLTRVTPIRDAQGNIQRWFGTNTDITQLRQTEEELKESKAQAELYLDLMGHDINNMHQIALGYLELARDMHPEAGENEFWDKPIEVLQRSAQLIRNVRKLQKLRDGVFQTELVDMCKVLVDVQREYGSVPHKAVSLNLNGCGHCHARANELLHDVFANLVSNAIKHTGDQADIMIDLDVLNDNSSQYCRVMVEDNGPGVQDEFKGNLFNRMLKSTSKAKGMGLGLYLVKSLVESYGGRVWVEDRVKGDHTKGARFMVMLPTAEIESH